MSDEWREQAACRGLTVVFFGRHVCNSECPPLNQSKTCPKLDGRTTSNITREQRAKAVCRTCAVIDECREWITASPTECKHGVVGGWSESERRRMNWKSTKRKDGDGPQV